jgi:glycosyltransferase involved in cell wall biosynthesis
MFNEKLCFILPSYNEEKTLINIIKEIKKFGKIIVVDDCSTDQTSSILSSLEVTNIRNEINLGYDLSLNVGFKKAIELNMDYAITIDADGQHDVDDAKKIINLLYSGNSIVKGKRKYLPRISEKFFSLYTNTFYNIFDPLCGLKGYNLKDCKGLDLLNPNNIIGTKTLLNVRRKKLNIAEFEIKQIKRSDVSRYGGFFNANIKIFKGLFNLILNDISNLFKIS